MKKSLILAASVITLTGTIASCGQRKMPNNALTVCLASEPQSIDPALNSTVDGSTMICHLNSGLCRFIKADTNDLCKIDNDIAETITKETALVYNHELNKETKAWEIKEYPNGMRYTIKIKQGCKWSNGDNLTVDDFIFSWNRASSNKIGADYAYLFEGICDGAWNAADEKCPGLVLKKINDYTFTIDLVMDVPYFDKLLAFPSFFPVHKGTIEKYDKTEPGTWAQEAHSYVSCGAYKMSEWQHKSFIRMEKNPSYWNANNVTCEEITFALADDDSAMLGSFLSGSFDMIDSVPNSQIKDLQERYPNEFHIVEQLGTYYVTFNMNSKTFKKADTEEKLQKVRRAISLFIDRGNLVKDVTGSFEEPANAFVSAGIGDVAGGEFVDHNGPNHDGKGYYDKGKDNAGYKKNVDEAIKLLKEVGYTYDGKKFTDVEPFKYLFNTGSRHEQIAKNFKDTWSLYGLDATLDSQEWATFLTNRKQGNFDVARNGWSADYDDPSCYLTLWTSTSGNNDAQFGKGDHATKAVYSADINRDGIKETGLTWEQSYDFLMDKSNKEADPQKRFVMLHELEDLLMETGAICPIYFYTDVYMMTTKMKGFYSSPLGYKYFWGCTIDRSK